MFFVDCLMLKSWHLVKGNEYFFKAENVKEMIMSVLGRGDSIQTPNPKPVEPNPKDENLVQKLMEGSMVITAQDDNMPKLQHSNFTSSMYKL